MPATNGVSLANQQNMQRVLAESRHTPFGVKVPKFAVPVTALGTVQVPAYGTQAQIVQYQAKANWYFVACGLVLQFSGSGSAPNPGDVTFTIDIDRPVNDFTSGYVEKDYGAIPILLGSFAQGFVWPVEFRHSDGEIVRIKATPVANMGTGPGNFFLACLLGFEWPQQGYEGF